MYFTAEKSIRTFPVCGSAARAPRCLRGPHTAVAQHLSCVGPDPGNFPGVLVDLVFDSAAIVGRVRHAGCKGTGPEVPVIEQQQSALRREDGRVLAVFPDERSAHRIQEVRLPRGVPVLMWAKNPLYLASRTGEFDHCILSAHRNNQRVIPRVLNNGVRMLGVPYRAAFAYKVGDAPGIQYVDR